METMHAAGRRRLPPVPRPAPERPSSRSSAVDAPADEPPTDQLATQVIDGAQVAELIDAELIDAELIDAELIDAELIDAELAALTASTAPEAGAAEDAGTGVTEVVDATDDTGPGATAQLQPAELTALMADDEALTAADAQPEDQPEPALPLPRAELGQDQPSEAPADEHDPAEQFVARLRSSAADFAAAAEADSAVVREAVPPARHRRARCRLVLRYTDGDLADVTLLGSAGAPGRPSRHGFERQILRWLDAGMVQDDAWVVDDPDAPNGRAVDLTAWIDAG